MNKFIKHGVLTIALFFLCGAFAVAQDKYEYGSLFSNGGKSKDYQIFVSLNDKFEEIDGSVIEGNSVQNYTPITKKVTDLSKQGWEVYNIIVVQPSGALPSHYYFVRRKLK